MKNWRQRIFTCLVFGVILLLVLLVSGLGIISTPQNATVATVTPTPDLARDVGPGYTLFVLLLIAAFIGVVIVWLRRKR